MPEHRTHDRVTRLVSWGATPLIFGLAVHNGVPPGTAIAVAGAFLLGGLSGLLLTPDLDVDKGCYSNFRMKVFDRTLGVLWRIWWWPYGKIAKHRGLSHTPVVGTLGRVLYGLPWLIPVIVISFAWPPFGAFWLLGLAWADTWHWLMDQADRAVGGRL